jgi:predicted Zn-dependent protease
LRTAGRRTGTPDTRTFSLPVAQTAAQTETRSATQREHARILASYGGVYENARLQ